MPLAEETEVEPDLSGLSLVRSPATHFDFPGPLAPLARLLAHRALVFQMVRREVAVRYRGSLLGGLWLIIQPLLVLAVYTFVFGIVLEARWPQEHVSDRQDFAFVLFAGLLVFWLLSDCIGRAPDLIVSHAPYVKSFVFPLEVLPFVALGTALFQLSIGVVVLFVSRLAWAGDLSVTAVFFPIVILPLMLFILGASWVLASIGVFARDIVPVVGLALTAAMFLSPIFYPASAIPEGARWIAALNPLAIVIDSARSVLLFGGMPDWRALSGMTVVGWITAWLGLAWFLKSRKAFADVL